MTLMFASILAITGRRWMLSCILFGAALSVKMNVLLYYPALLAIHLFETGLMATIRNQMIILALQVLPALPFIAENSGNYLRIAYNLGREFEWRWTVNWRFVGFKRFLGLQKSSTLLLLHGVTLLLWFIYRFQRPLRGALSSGRRKPSLGLQRVQMVRILFECNLIGIIFARSLHYQFLSWYSLTIPFLLLNGARGGFSRDKVGSMLIYLAIEYCWNVYPSTAFSSSLLFLMNIVLLLVSLARHRAAPMGRRGGF